MTYRPGHAPSLRKFLTGVRDKALYALEQEIDTYADAQRAQFVRKIEGQAFDWQPLSPSWLRKKEAKGADLRTMIATGHYVSSIRVFKSHPRRRVVRWRIGFHHSAKARDLDGKITNILLNLLARVHENGSTVAGIPARPHWGPHLVTMHRGAPSVRKVFSLAIVRAIKKKVR